ncbi:MAG: aminotransferase class I/II-fold pyridoxal phosphate-dependent enzyme [Vicinamibacterales bacterium]
MVKLSLGEPDFGSPPAVREAMLAAMDGRPLPYTAAPGLSSLRQAIAGFYRDRHGLDVDPARVFVTAGASAALLLVAAATVDAGSEVVLADPSYPCNRQLISSFGGRPVMVPTTPDARFQLDWASVAEAWTPDTRAVMIASPSNPTGTSIPTDELRVICAQARERQAWRIVDEIYLNLSDPSPNGAWPRSVLAVDDDAIVINSFSKYFGMTGWRLGWCVLPESLLPAIERLATNYFLCASTPIQLAALSCFLPESLAVCEERRIELASRRAVVLDGLERLGLRVPAVPDGAFYVYFDVTSTGIGSWEFCHRALHEARVALTPGRDFGDIGAERYVRLSYAASEDALREGLDLLGSFLGTLRDG